MPASNDEQYLLELVNDARLDPLGNAARYLTSYSPLQSSRPNIQNALTAFGVSGAALLDAFSALTPAQPLAFNEQLASAARAHDDAMIRADTQSHQVAGEADLGTRIRAQGYSFTSAGENIYAFAEDALYAHAGFMVDWGSGPTGMQSPPGHRTNIMNPAFREIGVAIVPEGDPATSVGPLVVTQDLGSRGSTGVLILGVAYNDADHDRFYSAGEGVGGLSVAIGSATAKSAASGGYALETTATGSQTIVLTGAGLGGPVQVTTVLAAGENAKFDVVDGNHVRLSVSATVSGPAAIIEGIGSLGLTLTTDGGSHSLLGTSGADVLTTGAGSDTIMAGAGNDLVQAGGGSNTVDGGVGDDTLVLGFASTEALITHNGGTVIISAGTVSDSATGFEHFRFTDGTIDSLPDRAVPRGSVDLGTRGTSWPLAGVGDFNGDHDSDILWRSPSTGQVDQWQMKNGGWGRSVDLGATKPANWQLAGTGDFDGDGTADVLWRDVSTSKVDQWHMKNGNWAGSIDLGATKGADWTLAGVGDFNADGTVDVLWRKTDTSQVDQWQMKDGYWSHSIDLGATKGVNWALAGVGDFNGDGTTDVLWRNTKTSQVDEWQMKNGNWSASLDLGATKGADWQVAGIGDFNHDGTDDVLWFNTKSGQEEYWSMKGGNWGGSVDLGTISPALEPSGIGDFNHDGASDALWLDAAAGHVYEQLWMV
jgi:uncharacterized protein YkwD